MSEMKVVLNLTIKRKWFDMIVSGEKREEYRSMNNTHVKNARERMLHCWGRYSMVLRNGYRMDSPAVAVRLKYISAWMRTPFPEWGEPYSPHYVISFDKILARGTYAEVKEWLEKGGKAK